MSTLPLDLWKVKG